MRYVLLPLIIITFTVLLSCNSIRTPDSLKHNNKAQEISTQPYPAPSKTEIRPNTTPSNQNTTSSHNDIENRKEQTIYTTITLEEAKLEISPRKHIEPIGAIRLDMSLFQTLNPQSILVFNDIEGMDYRLDIIETHTNSDGSLSMRARYTDEGIHYTTTITTFENEGYMLLSTASGLYEVEINKGVGYIYKSETIRKKMQDPYMDDTAILPSSKVNEAENNML